MVKKKEVAKKSTASKGTVKKSKIGVFLKKHQSDLLNKRFTQFYSELQRMHFDLHDHLELASFFLEINELQDKEYDLERQRSGKVALDEIDITTHLVPKLIIRQVILSELHPEHAKFARGFIHACEGEYCFELTGVRKAEHEDVDLHAKAHRKLHDMKMNDAKMYFRFVKHIDLKKKQEITHFIAVFGKDHLTEMADKLSFAVRRHRLLDEKLVHHHSSAMVLDAKHHIENHLDYFEQEVIDALRENI